MTQFLSEFINATEAGESVIGLFADLLKASDCVTIPLLLIKIKNFD